MLLHYSKMLKRRLIISIDDIVNILKDYCSAEDIPPDTMPVQFLLKPNERGAIAIHAESDAWAHGLPPLPITFRLKRFYGC